MKPCHYCNNPAPIYVHAQEIRQTLQSALKRDLSSTESDSVDDMHVCAGCVYLLKNPIAGPALVRGDINIGLRGKTLNRGMKSMIDGFLNNITKIKNQN
jgi:hypothetical protein